MADSIVFDNKVASDNIRVYPCSNRNPESDYMARLTTEYNLVSIINRVVDMKSFCVSTFQGYSLDTNPSISSVSEFMFNINGYLFNLNNRADEGKKGQFTKLVTYLKEQFDKTDADKQSQNDTLYACICVGQSSGNSQFIELLPSKHTTDDSSSTVPVSQGESNSYLGVMDVKEEGDTYFKGVTFVVGPWKNPLQEEGQQGWQKILTRSAEGVDTDTDVVFGKFTTDSAGSTIEKFILPIVQIETTIPGEGDKKVASTFSVPQDSRVKFATVANGSVRSVTIDDGELN